MKCLFCDDIYDNDSILYWVKLKNRNHFMYYFLEINVD